MRLRLATAHENGAGNSPPWLRRGKGVAGLRARFRTHHPLTPPLPRRGAVLMAARNLDLPVGT